MMKKGFLIVSLMFLALYATAQDIYTDMLAEGKTWHFIRWPYGDTSASTMLRFLFVVLFPLTSLAVSAQDYYEPFLVDGKAWYYETYEKLTELVIWKYYIGGDTLIAGKNCKKLMFERPTMAPHCDGALYEEDRKVWMFNFYNPINHGEEPVAQLLYDFGCKEGDVMMIDHAAYGERVLKVEKIDTVYTFTRPRRLFTLSDLSETLRNSGPAYWLEGVGSRLSMMALWPVRPGAVFVSCEIDGVQIADQSSFGPAALGTDIKEITTDFNSNDPIHDLQGKRLNGIPQKGIYIRNGRKYVR